MIFTNIIYQLLLCNLQWFSLAFYFYELPTVFTNEFPLPSFEGVLKGIDSVELCSVILGDLNNVTL